MLGCFGQEKTIEAPTVQLEIPALEKHYDFFYQAFNSGVQDYKYGVINSSVKFILQMLDLKHFSDTSAGVEVSKNTSVVFRLLYDLAIDSYDRAQVVPISVNKSLLLPNAVGEVSCLQFYKLKMKSLKRN